MRAKVGDRYVLEELEKRGWLLGGEGSGHLLALDRHTTGDGIVSALQVLQACVRSGKTRGAAAGRRDAVSADADQRAPGRRARTGRPTRRWPPRRERAEAELGDAGRVLIRASGTEPLLRVMVEARDEAGRAQRRRAPGRSGAGRLMAGQVLAVHRSASHSFSKSGAAVDFHKSIRATAFRGILCLFDSMTALVIPFSTGVAEADLAAAPEVPFLDRDHSILAFNERVLDWAHRADVPLLERLRYLCIVSSNLDEFFEVRANPHLMALQNGDHKGEYTVQSFEALAAAAHKLVDAQYALYNDELMPAFAREGMEVVSHGDRNAAQKQWVHEYFEREVRPLLIPVGLDPAHPFPQVANKSLNFIVRLGGKDAFGRENEIAIVKVPRVLPRLIRMPPKVAGKKILFVSLSSVIRAHLEQLFPGREVGQFSQFRVTRHSDLAVDDDDVRDLRTALRLGLQHRHYGQAVRLEVSSGCSDYLAEFLLQQFRLPEQALYRVHGPVNLVRLRAAHRPRGCAAPAVSSVQAVVPGAAGAGAFFLRADEAPGHPDPPAIRKLRRRAGIPARSGVRPESAGDQADHLPHRHRVGADGSVE